MKRTLFASSVCIYGALLASCATKQVAVKPAELTPHELAIVDDLGLDKDEIAKLEAEPIYKFNEREYGDYLGYIHEKIPNLADRVVAIGRKNINQPYELYLLGELPYESYDPQPIYCIDRSDCVVFSEHSYAAALSKNWGEFNRTLQRIRYIDGEVSVLTRNHYTEGDWVKSNTWLVKDLTTDLLGDGAASFKTTIKRKNFFEKRYKLETDFADEKLEVKYVPADKVMEIAPKLRNGDFVNIVKGNDSGGGFIPHVGLIAIADDGTVDLLHSTPPNVREEPIQAYMDRSNGWAVKQKKEGKDYFKGFIFYRLQDDPIANLKKIDGPDAPQIKEPTESHLVKTGG